MNDFEALFHDEASNSIRWAPKKYWIFKEKLVLFLSAYLTGIYVFHWLIEFTSERCLNNNHAT